MVAGKLLRVEVLLETEIDDTVSSEYFGKGQKPA
jgi:hypothetical protein